MYFDLIPPFLLSLALHHTHSQLYALFKKKNNSLSPVSAAVCTVCGAVHTCATCGHTLKEEQPSPLRTCHLSVALQPWVGPHEPLPIHEHLTLAEERKCQCP